MPPTNRPWFLPWTGTSPQLKGPTRRGNIHRQVTLHPSFHTAPSTTPAEKKIKQLVAVVSQSLKRRPLKSPRERSASAVHDLGTLLHEGGQLMATFISAVAKYLSPMKAPLPFLATHNSDAWSHEAGPGRLHRQGALLVAYLSLSSFTT